jgi:hypothetical protein
MLIRCPECGFERELNTSQIPDAAVMATCPQCRRRFRFRNDPTGANAAQAPQTPAPPAAGPEEDDPLPPGAITLAGKHSRPAQHPPRTKPERDATEDDAAKDDARPASRSEPASSRPDAENQRSLFTGSGTSDLAWETAPPSRLPMALYQTILQVLFAAPAFFTRVGASGASLLRPCIFYALIGTLQSVVQHFWLIARLNELASLQDPNMQVALDAMAQNLSLPMLLISMPLVLLIVLVFYAGLFHLMIRLVQPNRAKFSTTLRVVAYSAAPGVLCIVPVVGTYVASIWFAFCCFVGCKYALSLEWKRTVMAMLPLYVLLLAFSLHVNKMLMSMVQ